MKRLLGSLLLFFYAYALPLLAQDETPAPPPTFKGFKMNEAAETPNVVKVHPLRLLFGRIIYGSELNVVYERSLVKHHSLTLGFNFNFPGLLWISATDSLNLRKDFSYILGAGAQIGYRFYPLKRAPGPRGLFVGPVVNYNYAKMKVKDSDDYFRFDNFSAGVIAGYQFVIKKKVALELHTGLGYKNERIRYWDQFTQQYEEVQTIWDQDFLRTFKHVQIYFGLYLGGVF